MDRDWRMNFESKYYRYYHLESRTRWAATFRASEIGPQ